MLRRSLRAAGRRTEGMRRSAICDRRLAIRDRRSGIGDRPSAMVARGVCPVEAYYAYLPYRTYLNYLTHLPDLLTILTLRERIIPNRPGIRMLGC